MGSARPQHLVRGELRWADAPRSRIATQRVEAVEQPREAAEDVAWHVGSFTWPAPAVDKLLAGVDHHCASRTTRGIRGQAFGRCTKRRESVRERERRVPEASVE